MRCSSDTPIRVLGLGPDEETVRDDFEAAARRPISWSLDIYHASSAEGVGRLVVADPTGDLQSAREEAATVREPTDLVLVGSQATVRDVVEALQRVDEAHFAVHGRHDAFNPSASHLVLSDGVLRASDVLALERVPRRVFLSGCETGRSRNALGLAQAFIAAGSEWVVASDRPVSDADTRALVTAWTASIGAPSERLAKAKQKLLMQNPNADFALPNGKYGFDYTSIEQDVSTRGTIEAINGNRKVRFQELVVRGLDLGTPEWTATPL